MTDEFAYTDDQLKTIAQTDAEMERIVEAWKKAIPRDRKGVG